LSRSGADIEHDPRGDGQRQNETRDAGGSSAEARRQWRQCIGGGGRGPLRQNIEALLKVMRQKSECEIDPDRLKYDLCEA
jgi:hypothetical protein